MLKRLSALLIAIVITITYTTFSPASADVFEAPRAASIELPFAGKGSEASPYLIGTGEELKLLASIVNSGVSVRGLYFRLTGDVDISGCEWSPIGSDAEHPFDGSFSGGGNTVYGLMIEHGGRYSALFGYSTGSIKRVNVSGARVAGTECAAAVVAVGSAENCRADGAVSGERYVGGVVGDGSAFYCESACSVEGREYVGGVIGIGDAIGSVFTGEASGESFTGNISGLGVVRDTFERDETRVPDEEELKGTKYSVSEFVKWALTHIEYTSIPVGATLIAPRSSCGTDTWQYLYGSVRQKINETAVSSYYSNYYNKYMFSGQYGDLTAGWIGDYSHATDCQGLLDAWMTYVCGVTTDFSASMNYDYWCTQKGAISSINRNYVVGEAVFRYSRWLERMAHVGWICGFDDDGEPLVVEAKGINYGVIVTRLSDGTWTHRGLMTVKFYYDATLTPNSEPSPTADEPVQTECPDAGGSSPTRAVWSGGIASGFAGGSGTQADPYLISTAEQLAYLAYAVSNDYTYSGKYIELTNDIWLNDTTGWTTWDHFTNRPAHSWTPIGCFTSNKNKKPFRGSFNGKGHTIYGMFIDVNSLSCQGLFGYVGENQSGHIRNLNVARSVVSGGNNTGGIVGYMGDYGSIESCSFSGIVKGEAWTGGIVGYAVRSSGTSYIYNCANLGSIKGGPNTGGIVGRARANCIISECENTGSLVKGFKMAGGIVGMAAYSTVSVCRNHCPATGADMIGGIAGSTLNASVSECYNGVDLSATKRLGGIAGSSTGGSVKNCFNTGNQTGREKTGGLIGHAKNTAVQCCYNVGTVAAAHIAGAAAALSEGQTAFTNVYVLAGCCQSGSAGGTQMSADRFNRAVNYAGFDFQSIWIVDPGTVYPAAELRRVCYTADKIPDIPQPEPDPTPAPTAAPTPAPTTVPTAAPTANLPGDADDNGYVEATDALIILRLAMGMIDEADVPGVARCDMTGDGVIGADDALIILRIAMGIIDQD
ncbi:MAG: dockerin type I repeat-containing protein [Clostridia bacterium]|nr:dockerin type I repeat-containing protein [Clostridia bacterium]